jgi:hypothetical protein
VNTDTTTRQQPPVPLFPAAALNALRVPGVAARWQAVQAHLHPVLAQLAEIIAADVARQFARQWPLYETSFKSQRFVNRGQGERAPIDDYHVAFDRPPRGAGILVSVSGSEQAVLVGLQLWGTRKPQLRQLWEGSPQLWQPLVERIATQGQARFSERARARGEPEADHAALWIDRYLRSRSAHYLWAGFVFPWAELNRLPAAAAQAQLGEAVLALFPLCEALMEQAEAREPQGAALLREERVAYGVSAPQPDVETLIERIQRRGFTWSDTLLRAYHVALHTRPLVILPGISGTGKTRLTRLYADAVHALETADNPYYLLVAVQPDWHNARDLLGYYNALSGLYHPTPFLRFVLRATADPQQPYFVCLDEMNLARPEYYLAPVLSALETVERTLDLGTPAPDVQTVSGEQLRSPLRLPLNLHIIGTVNVDESTYTLSDKLLDRANVIELTDVDLPGFRARYPQPIPDAIWQPLMQIHALVARAGQPFGYRTLNEVLHYIEQAAGVLTAQQALDLQIKQKILPRLRGEESPRLRRALTDLLALLLDLPHANWQRAAQVTPEQLAAAPLPESAAKVQRMLERLDQDGFTDFYG